MEHKRTRIVVDKKFQYGAAIRSALLPFITLLIVSAVLFFFAQKNNSYIEEVVDNQGAMIEMFLTTPALHNSESTIILEGEKTFKQNIGMLKEIRYNSQLVLYFIVIITILQAVVIFAFSIINSHRITGPLYVMTQYLRDLQNGKKPGIRPLREKDRLKDFHEELIETIHYAEPHLPFNNDRDKDDT